MRRLALCAYVLLGLSCGVQEPTAGAPAREELATPLRFPPLFRFPRTAPYASSVVEGRITNEGATPLVVEIRSRPPFHPLRSRFELSPGAERPLRFYFLPAQVGHGEGPEVEAIAWIGAAGQEHPLVLQAEVGLDAPGCPGPCQVRVPGTAECLPASDGTACGTADACSDGGFCVAGECLPAPSRDGAFCGTPCGGGGTCRERACVPEGGTLEPRWSWQREGSTLVHAGDEAGILLRDLGAGEGGELVALSPDGEERWRRPRSDDAAWRQAAGLVLARGPGGLFALDAKTGALRWELGHGAELAHVAGDVLILASSDPTLDESHLLLGVEAASGVVRWRRELLARSHAAVGRELSQSSWLVLGDGAHLRVAVNGWWREGDSEPQRHHALFAIDPSSGEELWARPGGANLERMLVDEEGRAFVSAGVNESGGRLQAIGGDGELLWEREVGLAPWPWGGRADGPAALGPGLVFLQGGGAYERSTGAHRYDLPPGTHERLLQSRETGVVVRYEASDSMAIGDLVAFDLRTGEERFTWPLWRTRTAIWEIAPLEKRDGVRFALESRTVDGGTQLHLCTVGGDGRLLEEQRFAPAPAGRITSGPRTIGPWWYRQLPGAAGDRAVEFHRFPSPP